ncbi:MAG: hypothetical protein IKO83_01415 [Oscillospiraceae bacterium]|nr:hypothetical protein [Oscillospiraceae bacterium]MBR7190516.1 hypothetical protein [Oscillospiraceae bacterium]
MIAGFLLWLGLYGLVLFMSFDTPMCRRDQRYWVFGSMVVATLLAIPVYMILLAMQIVLAG